MPTRNLAFAVLAALMCVRSVDAHTIDVSFGPLSVDPVSVGQQFEVDIIGVLDETGEAVGGAMVLSFAPGVLRYVSVNVNELLATVAEPGVVVDTANGSIDSIGFASDSGIGTGTFTIATLTFAAIGAGVSELLLEDANDSVFSWQASTSMPGDTDLDPRFELSSVTVTPAVVSPPPPPRPPGDVNAAAVLVPILQLLDLL